MKRIFLILICLLGLVLSSDAQFSDRVNPYRVVVISPNYNNTYPRFSTLQNAYLAIDDSASASTGKYFIINAVTSFNNISDYTSAWRDSIVNRSPYMVLTSFGQAFNDSVIGVTAEEFQLVAGILSLNTATAGDGLSFSNHMYLVNVDIPLSIQSDTLTLLYSSPLYLTPNTLGLKRFSWSGLEVSSDSGLRVLSRSPLSVKQDTTFLKYKLPFVVTNDSLDINYDNEQFDVAIGVSPSFSIKMDSGITKNSNGIQLSLGSGRLSFLSNKKLTIPDAVAGDGLIWSSNTLKLNLATYNPTWGVPNNLILNVVDDSLTFYYAPYNFTNSIDGLRLLASQLGGILTDSDSLRLFIDENELENDLTALGRLQINSKFGGNGLKKISDSLNVITNEYARVVADTVKVRTSTILQFWFDSLTTNTAYAYPTDTTGFGMFTSGKIKRWSFSHFDESGGAYVTDVGVSDQTFIAGDRIAVFYDQGTGKISIRKNASNITVISPSSFTVPSYQKATFSLELWLEAE